MGQNKFNMGPRQWLFRFFDS